MVYDVAITKGTVTFTFQEGDVNSVHSTISSEPDENIMPISGPMSNQNYDFNGVTKNIEVKGVLTDAAATRCSGTGAPTITSKIMQKLWLESLADGNQSAMTFTSNYEVYSVEGSGSTAIADADSNYNATYPAAIVATTVFVISMGFDEQGGDVNTIPFTMTLRVSS